MLFRSSVIFCSFYHLYNSSFMTWNSSLTNPILYINWWICFFLSDVFSCVNLFPNGINDFDLLSFISKLDDLFFKNLTNTHQKQLLMIVSHPTLSTLAIMIVSTCIQYALYFNLAYMRVLFLLFFFRFMNFILFYFLVLFVPETGKCWIDFHKGRLEGS